MGNSQIFRRPSRSVGSCFLWYILGDWLKCQIIYIFLTLSKYMMCHSTLSKWTSWKYNLWIKPLKYLPYLSTYQIPTAEVMGYQTAFQKFKHKDSDDHADDPNTETEQGHYPDARQKSFFHCNTIHVNVPNIKKTG